MEEVNDNIEGAFGESLKNDFSESSDYDLDLEIDAMNEAKKLHQYIGTEKMEKVNHRTLYVHSKNGVTYRFQSTLVSFIRKNGELCRAEFSVPIDFEGPIRLWAEDLRGKKVWSTIKKIYEWRCNPLILFDFLGKYTHRFSEQEMSDDLPF